MLTIRGAASSFRRLIAFQRIGLEQVKYELLSRITALLCLLCLAAYAYSVFFSSIARTVSARPGLIGFGLCVVGSMVHYAVVLAVSMSVHDGLRAFSFSAGLLPREELGLQRAWFVAKNWHIPFVDLLVFFPLACALRLSALPICVFVAYSLAAWCVLPSCAFSIRARAGAEARKRQGSFSARRLVARGNPRLVIACSALLGSPESLALGIAAVVIGCSGARDLRANAAAMNLGDAQRWRMLYSLCAAFLAQAALSLSSRSSRGYYRLFPVGYARYLLCSFLPILVLDVAFMSPLLIEMTKTYPAELPCELLYLAAFTLSAFVLAGNQYANGAALALGLFLGSVIAALLWMAAPIAGALFVVASASLAVAQGRRHFLLDEVLS
jgi:hypothetical protein